MDWLSVINLVGIIGIIILLLTRKEAGQSQDNKELVSQVLLGLNQQQLNLQANLTETISQSSQSQNQALSQNLQNLERRFGEVQAQLSLNLKDELGKIQMLQNQTLAETKQKFDSQIQDQKLHFEQIKTDNQKSLQEIQASLQGRLNQAVQSLIELNKTELKSIQDLNRQSLDIIAKTNQDKLSQIQTQIEIKLDENLQRNIKSFENVTKHLGEMQSTAQKMIESTSSIDKLNNIFERTSSKSFGNFGEKYLESLLKEYINPKHWEKQVKVPGSSEIIDFVISIGDQKIGIDSKFPVTKYQDYIDATAENKKSMMKVFLNGVIQMAAEIKQKYAKEGFVSSLLMYLPSDGMYSDVVNMPDVMQEMQKYKVTLTSPTTILPLIALIHEYEFKVDVQDRADEIIRGLGVVKRNVNKFQDEFRKLGDKIRQAQLNYDSADKSLTNVSYEIKKLETSQGENTTDGAILPVLEHSLEAGQDQNIFE